MQKRLPAEISQKLLRSGYLQYLLLGALAETRLEQLQVAPLNGRIGMSCVRASLRTHEADQRKNVSVVVDLPEMPKSAAIDRRTHYRNALTRTQSVWHFLCKRSLRYADDTALYLRNGLPIITHKKTPQGLMHCVHREAVLQFGERSRRTWAISGLLFPFFGAETRKKTGNFENPEKSIF